MTMTVNSQNHQNSARYATPSKTAYFLKTVFMASPNFKVDPLVRFWLYTPNLTNRGLIRRGLPRVSSFPGVIQRIVRAEDWMRQVPHPRQ